MNYWAHSDPSSLPETDPEARWQPLKQHLRQVADLARQFAVQAKPEDEGFHFEALAAGYLHDLGKYTLEFQEKIRGKTGLSAPHSAHGAAIAHESKANALAFAIAGHHAGLPNPQGGRAGLRERLREVRAALEKVWRTATQDCPELSIYRKSLPASSGSLSAFDIRTRMLFSCLVDADRIDSSGEHHLGAPLAASERLERVLGYISKRAALVPDGVVKHARLNVLAACRAAAVHSGGLFSLTVPTGGGKTLASMVFALERAVALAEVRRIIVVIPYLSIIEQNAQVLIDALGPESVLEHHSGDCDDRVGEESYENPRMRRATENWDAPIVVTTSVRFFESLFSHRPSDLRRVHNIARSVVILDEVQTLPRKFLEPMLRVMEELAQDWGTTFVFCTATQPAFERSKPGDPRWAPNTLQEIMPEPRELFAQLTRVEVEWRPAPCTWNKIASGLAEAGRALCIVNTRDQAAALYSAVAQRALSRDSIVHLSSRMCPAHRLEKIQQIKGRLADPSKPACIVVSTQLVEAGVDLDFPVVYRAMGPLDSIAQAAGRCDREGELTAALGRPGGRLVVFEPEDPKLPEGVYREATEITRAMVRAGGVSLDDPDCLRSYFERLYGDANLGQEIEDLRKALHFRDVGEAFEMIPENTQSIFVPYGPEARRLIERLDSAGVLYSELRRKLQRYTVGIYAREFEGAARSGIVREVRPGSAVWICQDGFYDETLGFVTAPSADQMVVG